MNQRSRTNNKYNLDLLVGTECNNSYGIPTVESSNIVPEKLIGFNYAKSTSNHNVGIHFYLDDYQFERVWNNPYDYIELLRKFDVVLTPDFSLYTDMPKALQIYNTYRNRVIGCLLEHNGIETIPTISWADEDSFGFCFEGIEKNSIVSISTIGVKKSNESIELWKRGVDEMIKRLAPSKILIYGERIDYDFKDIDIVYYNNERIERVRSYGRQTEAQAEEVGETLN